MLLRHPTLSELDFVYMMGYESWHEGATKENYLQECRESPKYKRGTWYVLGQHDKIIASLITYSLEAGVVGIGSIVTAPEFRKQGHAAKLINGVIAEYEKQGIKQFMLYTEVGTAYYEKFKFQKLDECHQKSNAGIAMVRGDVEEFLRKFLNQIDGEVPRYF